MKKTKKVILLVVLIIAVLICGANIVQYMRMYGLDKQWISQTIPSETYFPPEELFDNTITREWRTYKLAKRLISKAEYIYEGEVIDITYEVLDDKEIVMVYTISVKQSYKGETPDETYVVRGGVVQEDIDKWEQLAVETDGATVDVGSYINLEVGKEYVFLISSRDESGYDNIVNSSQFAFRKYKEVDQSVYPDTKTQTEEYRVLMLRLGVIKINHLTGG